jgi:myo-inositol-1(or 4)-monophosphatase
MHDLNLEDLCTKSISIIRETGVFIGKEFGQVGKGAVETKSLNSLVSYVDTRAEEMLVNGLEKVLPGSTFLTEEKTVQQTKGKYQWIIDPLDGTTNFLHQLPCFAISVALTANDKPVMGIILDVIQNDCYHAIKGHGAFLNGQPIKVSDTRGTPDSLMATGFPYYDFSREKAYFEVFTYFMHNTRGIRRMGAAAIDLAYVAAGRFDLYFEYSLHPWDVAAGAFLVQEAGGKVSDFSGGDRYQNGKEIIAGNPAIFDHSLPIIKKAFEGV